MTHGSEDIFSDILIVLFKFIEKMYIDRNVWSVGYYSSTIGLDEETIKKYIEYQGKEEVPQTLTLFD